MTTDLLTLLGVAAPLATMMSLWILAQISRRFGEVTQRPPLYRGFYAALALWVFPLVTRLLAMGLTDGENDRLGGNSLEALVHNGPAALSVTLAVVIVWRYWGWLVTTREDQARASAPATKRSGSVR
ncbi:MAG: hypothetical protein GX573_00185 [Chloroflexi bacterium]|nr:hypothetical protein [Chloroflexota bacterium]